MVSVLLLDWVKISVIAVLATGIKIPFYKKLFYRTWRTSRQHFIFSAVTLLLPCLLMPIFAISKSYQGHNLLGSPENEALKALFLFLVLMQGFLVDLSLVGRRDPKFNLKDLLKTPKSIVFTLAINFLVTLFVLFLMHLAHSL